MAARSPRTNGCGTQVSWYGQVFQVDRALNPIALNDTITSGLMALLQVTDRVSVAHIVTPSISKNSMRSRSSILTMAPAEFSINALTLPSSSNESNCST